MGHAVRLWQHPDVADNPRKLLIVEDDPGIQSQLRWCFEDYEVLSAVDRESAHEILAKRANKAAEEAGASNGGGWGDIIFGGGGGSGDAKSKGRPRQGMGEMIGKDLQRSISRTIATTIKNIIVKSITGRSR